MYWENLDLFKKYGINLSLKDLYIGISNSYFPISILSEYFDILYTSSLYNEKYDVLLEEFEYREDALNCLKKLVDVNNIKIDDREDKDVKNFNRKLMYVRYSNALETINNYDDLVYEVNDIAEDFFYYPPNIYDCVWYTPSAEYNILEHTKLENYKRMVNILKKFLENEKLKIEEDDKRCL
mgnify:FL=1